MSPGLVTKRHYTRCQKLLLSPLTLTLSPRRGRGNKCLCHGAVPGSPSPYPFAPSGIPAKVSKPDSMGRGNNAQVAALVFPLAPRSGERVGVRG